MNYKLPLVKKTKDIEDVIDFMFENDKINGDFIFNIILTVPNWNKLIEGRSIFQIKFNPHSVSYNILKTADNILEIEEILFQNLAVYNFSISFSLFDKSDTYNLKILTKIINNVDILELDGAFLNKVIKDYTKNNNHYKCVIIHNLLTYIHFEQILINLNSSCNKITCYSYLEIDNLHKILNLIQNKYRNILFSFVFHKKLVFDYCLEKTHPSFINFRISVMDETINFEWKKILIKSMELNYNINFIYN